MQTDVVREKLFTMRMSAEEWTRAETLAKHYGLSVAGLLRMLLKDKERSVASEHPAQRKPTRKR